MKFGMNTAIGGHHNSVIFNHLQSVITSWRAHEFGRWKQH